MDSKTGQIYKHEEIQKLEDDIRARLVELTNDDLNVLYSMSFSQRLDWLERQKSKGRKFNDYEKGKIRSGEFGIIKNEMASSDYTNKFLVSGTGELTSVLNPNLKNLTKADVKNLVAWLAVVSNIVEDNDIDEIIREIQSK